MQRRWLQLQRLRLLLCCYAVAVVIVDVELDGHCDEVGVKERKGGISKRMR